MQHLAYQAVIDLTRGAQKEAGKEGAPSPFEAPSPELPEATPAGLPAPLREGLANLGWATLMPVQSATIPYLLDGRDMVVQSRTGSGKTGAFLLPMLTRLDPAEKSAQALVLCPTRELARQIYDEFERMTAEQPADRRVRAVAVYGGTSYQPQLQAFEEGVQLVIGTPGRVLDHLERRTLRLDRLRMLILDEADEMLSMGFYPDMRQLKRYLPRERQGAMFSATMPYQVQRVGKEFLSNPGFLAMAGGRIHVDLMAHRAYAVAAMGKDRALARLVEMENPTAALIFANRRSEVEYLSRYLQNSGYDADGISSDLTQKAREEVMGRLRAGRLRLLIATDVAARGIDVPDLSHVFQYDVPQDREYYVHRAGRTARAGKAGVSIALVTRPEMAAMKEIATRYDLPLEWRDVPTDEEVAARVGERVVVLLEDRLRTCTALERERFARFVPVVRNLVAEGEPELLAMLLDEASRATLAAPVVPHDVIDAPESAGEIEYPDDDESAAPSPPKRRRGRPAPPPDAPGPEDAG